jgi:hypothetical protein
MSQHHRKVKWSTLSRKYRAQIAPLLPLPCVNRCVMGGTVYPDQQWDVAHVNDLAEGGETGRNDVGPAHVKCNRGDGGRKGAAITNRGRSAATAAAKGRREW